jgi:hypothetical protein
MYHAGDTAPATGKTGMRQRTSERLGTRGVAYVEYVTLLALVTVVGSVAVFGLGAPLLSTYRYAQLILAIPIP